MKIGIVLSAIGVLISVIQTQVHSTCDTQVTVRPETKGRITSPNYPSNYPPNTNCTYRFNTSSGSDHITLTFSNFSLEIHSACLYDYVEVHDGPTKGARLLGRHCGTHLPPSYTSSGRYLTVLFNADGSRQYSGFKFSVTSRNECEPNPCENGGTCQDKVDSFTCTCTPNFQGGTCSEVIPCTFDPYDLPSGVGVHDDSAESDQRLPRNFAPGKQIFVKCLDEDAVLVGDPNLICVLGGVWNRAFNTTWCRKSCHRPPIPANGRLVSVEASLEFSVGSRLRVECDEGYELSSEFEVVCEGDPPAWIPQLPTCERKGFPPLETHHFTLTTPSIVKEPTSSCVRKVHVQTGNISLITSPNYPRKYHANTTCTYHLVSCSISTRISIAFNHFSLEDHTSCEFDYLEVYDGPTTNARLLGKHCGSELPPTYTSTGRYLTLYFRSDDSRQFYGFSFNATVDFSMCGQASVPFRNRRRRRSKIGEFAKVIGGTSVEKPDWPWQALLLLQHRYSRANIFYDDSVIAGGSLITPQWVLTAGHVFDNIRDENKLFVAVGIFERPLPYMKNLDHNVEMFAPRKIILHSQFDRQNEKRSSRTNFDYDLALIRVGVSLRLTLSGDFWIFSSQRPKFNGTIPLSSYVRPVCLPCSSSCTPIENFVDDNGNRIVNDDDRNDVACHQEGRWSTDWESGELIVTGFGHSSADLTIPNNLQQATLRLTPREDCVRGVEHIRNTTQVHLNYTDRMICASSNSGAERWSDACHGDSGGPLIRKYRHPIAKQSYWMEVGIVSFGMPCNTQNTSGFLYPGYYTDVAKMHDWIESVIASNH